MCTGQTEREGGGQREETPLGPLPGESLRVTRVTPEAGRAAGQELEAPTASRNEQHQAKCLQSPAALKSADDMPPRVKRARGDRPAPPYQTASHLQATSRAPGERGGSTNAASSAPPAGEARGLKRVT